MSVSVDTLAVLSPFSGLASATLEQLSQVATTFTFDMGATFYRQGDPPSGLFSLQSGQVKLYRQSKDRLQILALLGAGETFGAESFANNALSPCTAQAVTSGTALFLPPDELQQLLTEHSDFLALLLELVTGRLRQFTGLVHSLAFRDVSARLAEVLLKLASLEQSAPTPDGLHIKRLLTQQELAEMVGTAREVVYRTLKKLEKAGLLRATPTEIIVLDLEGLTRLARQELR